MAVKRPSLIHGIAAAAFFSCTALVVDRITLWFFADPVARKCALALLVLGYVLYLLRLNGARIGNVALFSCTLLGLGGGLLGGAGTPALVGIGVALVWIVRSLLAYSSVVMALADGALSAVALGAAAWAFTETGSLFWAVWCFALTQALWPLLPERPGSSAPRETQGQATDAFSAAHRAAEAALRRIARERPSR